MKKTMKIVSLMLVVVMSLALLTSCGISQKTADDINAAVKTGELKTLDELKKQLGDPTTGGVDPITKSGVLVWVNGCKNLEDVYAKVDAGKTLKALTVTFVAGKATLAAYGDYTPEKK